MNATKDLTVNSVMDQFGFNFDISEFKSIKCLNEYKRLNMTEMIEKMRYGVIAEMLEKANMKLIHIARRYRSGRLELNFIDYDGSENVYGTLWSQTSLKNFKRPVPYGILERLPDDAADKADVFYAVKDPIIAYPLEKEEIQLIPRYRKTLIMRRRVQAAPRKSVKKCNYFAGVYKWDD